MKHIPNTLLEGFTLVTPAGEIDNLPDVTKTNRGRIVAVDIITSPLIQAPYIVSLLVGGQSIVEGMPSKAYIPEAYPNNYNLIPLSINDGQTFQLNVDATTSAQPESTSVVFLREGASRSFKRNSLLSTWILSQGFFQFPANTFTQFEGLIPKNRGKCIGFEIIKNNIGFSQADLVSTVTFSVGGVELVLNAPWSIFDPLATRPYTKFFTDLEPGSTFNISMNAGDGQPRIMNVLFYFETK